MSTNSHPLPSSTHSPISDLDRLLPASDPSTSDLVPDYDERYPLSSATESDESSGLLDDQLDANRSSKRRRRILSTNPTTTTATATTTTTTTNPPISSSSSIIINPSQIPPPPASSSSSSPASNPSIPPIYHDDPSLNRSSYSDDSRCSSYTSRPSSPLDPPPHHLLPHHSSHPLLWSQSNNPSSSYHHHHLYHLKHHHHHHHHHHPTSTPDHPNPNSSLVNLSSGTTSDHTPTGCLDTVSSRFHGLLSPSSTNHHPPQQQQQHELQLSDDLVSNPESEFFHSHHLRTSAHPRRNNRRHAFLHSSATDSKRSPKLPSSSDPSPEPVHHRSKSSWFSSRRFKRKNSVHALSATSSSSTTSLHSSPSSLDQLLNQKSSDPSIAASNYLPTSSRRSSTSHLRRWTRSLGSQFALSLRSLNKSLGHRLPLGILLGLVLFISFAVSLTVFLVHYLDTDKEPLPWRTYCQEQREFPHQLADSLEPVNVFVGVFSIDSGYERRHLIRSTYARHSRPIDPLTGQIMNNVQLKFVLGRPRIQHVRRVALEMETYNDIVILDIQENMNRGKTYAFMNWASENATIPVYYHPLHEPKPKTGINGIGGVMVPEGIETINVGVGFKKADFVVKADDDAFIVLSELERHLRVAPRTMTYWGYLIRNLFMGGECYALSADLVSYVASSSEVLNYLTGAEDKKVAKWMRIHPNATQINWVTERCWIYDHPKAGTTYAHGFLFPDEVQRVRQEGKSGLTDTEIATRGVGRTQSYSTVSRWKERYIAPKSTMTMEEEVEALVEGGGRFTNTGWKRPVEQLVPIDKVLFDPKDDRLLKSSIIGGPDSVKSSEPDPGQSTLPVRDHYQEPSLKFGRPPSELMAKMPAMEDLPDSALKDKLREGLAAEMTDGRKSQATSKSRSSLDPLNQPSGSSADPKPSTQFVPAPTLRYDPGEIQIRNQRFLNRPYGGTVVVHFLKRNEWFLETSLILLGRSKTWDDGLIPVVFEPTHKMRASKPEASSIQPTEDNSLVVSSDPTGQRSQALSTVVNPSSHDRFNRPSQKKIEVGRVADWGKFNKVEEVKVGGMFGGARMFGSPVIEKDGTIREGRRIRTSVDQPAGLDHGGQRYQSDSDTPPSTGQLGSSNLNQGDHQSFNPNNRMAPKDHERLRHPVQDPSSRLEGVGVEKDDEDDEDDEIRKTQFGGAGWIRGRPRLRLTDENDGPKFVLASKFDAEKANQRASHTLDQSLKSSVEGSIRADDPDGHSTTVQEPDVKLDDPDRKRETEGIEGVRESKNQQGTWREGEREADEDEDLEYEFEDNLSADASLVLGKHRIESFGSTAPSHPRRPELSSSSSSSGDELTTGLLLGSVA